MAYSTESIVEATSLSAITAIASNPPQQPNASNRDLRQPLVLYIARVPGSRDVFLTPLKPREKVVSAEDVESSLYYVHIHNEADHEILEQPKRTSADVDASQLAPIIEQPVRNQPPALPLRRKVSGSALPYPVNDQMPGAATQRLSSQPSQRISRKPVNATSNNDGPPPVPPHVHLPIIPSRSLPKPPADQVRRPSLHDENKRLLRHADHSEDNNPYFRQYEPEVKADSETPDITPGSLTLIRRDPALGEQWNVASIYDPPVYEVCSPTLLVPGAAKRTKRGGAPVYLDISNPGYASFIDKDRPESRISISTQSFDSEPPPEGVFRRRLHMPGSRYGEHTYGHSRAKSTEDTPMNGDMKMSLRNRLSVDISSTRPATMNKRSKSYTFTSPWDGRCEFSTGATGKSLKCRHTHSGRTTDVSELRFNLPNSSKSTPTPLSEKRASYFSRHTRHDSWDGGVSPGFVLNDDGKVDLTLGQEKAGGGCGGKQAKLGKLIVEPEGLVMLDLLVAANVGLWWRAYERNA
ncbi:hypothetical protein LTR86_002024 [Recurvomyces mirabilis]|nr:hypothetical protein LTR86_002024 [Recurvomyces mirabilis]